MANDAFPISLLSKMYSDSRFSDVTFQVENEVFKVHKAVLGYSCPYFEVLLYGNTNEASQNVITLKETLPRAFKCVIDFIYTGNIDRNTLQDDSFCKEVIAIAHEYQFDVLMSKLIDKIPWYGKDFPFVASVLEMALKYNCGPLKEKCFEYIDNKATSIIDKKNEFALLPFNTVTEIVRRQSFVVEEIDLFHCLMDYKERHSDIDVKDILSHLRLGLISIDNFKNFILPLNVYDWEMFLMAKENVSKRYKPSKFHVAISDLMIENGQENSLYYNEPVNLRMGQILQCFLDNIIANHITFYLTDTDIFRGGFKILVKGDEEMEYTQILDVTDELRFGKQVVHMTPRSVSAILVETTSANSLPFKTLEFKCYASCGARINVSDGHLIGHCSYGARPTSKIIPLANGGSLPGKIENETQILFAFSQPHYFESLKLDRSCVLKLPLTIYVKGRVTEEWKKLEKLTVKKEIITFPLSLISLVLFVGTDLKFIKFSCL